MQITFFIEMFCVFQSLQIKADFPCVQTRYSSNSGSKGSNWGEKLRRYWSVVVTAGIFGIGAANFLCDPSKETRTLFTIVYCAPDEKCGCKKKKCECKENKCEESECLRKTECEEELIRKANSELDHALLETKGKAVEFTEAALKAYCDAIQMIKLFIDKVYCAVEEENLDSPRFVEVWCDVHKTLTKRCDLSKKAMEKGQCAWELLNRLRDIIECGKCCKYTSCNPLLVTAEETLICAEKEICDKKKMMEDLLKESRVVEQYRNIIEEFRRDLKGEADSLLPSQECRVTKLNNNELNMILTHAYKKLLRVQAELAKKEEPTPTETDIKDNQDDKC